MHSNIKLTAEKKKKQLEEYTHNIGYGRPFAGYKTESHKEIHFQNHGCKYKFKHFFRKKDTLK